MTRMILKTVSMVGAGLMLSACGGGGAGTGGVMGATAANLIGVNAETGANPRVVSLVQTTGTSDSSNGLNADFNGYTFAADSGFENGAAVENGNTIGILTELDLPTQTEMRLYDGAYDPGTGVIAIYYGIAGTAPTAALPTTGSATWTGSGFADLVSAGGTADLGTGAASVTATFGGGMTASITGLTGVVDAVNLTGLSISGNRFTGTTVQSQKSGAATNVVGANGTGRVNGVFSGGPDAMGAPDEVGGLFTLTGDDATLIGGFLAD